MKFKKKTFKNQPYRIVYVVLKHIKYDKNKIEKYIKNVMLYFLD